ncbi:MAG: pyruvate kinase [Oligoflexales bacterium]|nr:pyruvate kinase [Oligoflexales bacterium]
MQEELLTDNSAFQGLGEFKQGGPSLRRCKIIGTLGPSSSDEQSIRNLIAAGLNVARLNFSHGDHETHLRRIELIRRISKEMGRHVTLLQDLQGPKIRCGELLGGSQLLEEGQIFTLSYGHKQTDPRVIPIDYPDLIQDVRAGETVMMDDGLLILNVENVSSKGVEVQVKDGGLLKSRKGVNFPNSRLSVRALTEKDNRDLLFGVTHKLDAVALSFVQSADDIMQCKKILQALGSDTPIIAKIEKLSAMQQIADITKTADALMVARGDLGVEGGVEKVPIFQRRIIEEASLQSKPVIIATQMLESMVQNPRASLAEVTDVANAVLEGADCVMLSAEVAAGKYPVECVKMMGSIIDKVENWRLKKTPRYLFSLDQGNNEQAGTWENHRAIARAACEAADSFHAKAIICLTLTGSIARLIASWRPTTPIIAVSPRLEVVKRFGLTWGVFGLLNPVFYNTDELLQKLPKLLKELNVVKSGDIIVITAGIPISSMSSTNMLKIDRIP